MGLRGLPFSLEVGGTLTSEPAVVLADGVVFTAAAVDTALPPLLTVAWLDEPAGVTLDAAVDEDLARALDAPGSVLIDRTSATVAGAEAVRTLLLHRTGEGVPTAAEPWRVHAVGRRWTLSALTALADQPVWGPRLAEVAGTWRPA
jgi:hypothetical protein